MLSRTTIIEQREIPGEPPSAVVRHYSLGAVAELQIDLRAAIPTSPPVAVGVSVGLAPLGAQRSIETIALATRDRVFCLSLPQSPSPTQRKVLQDIFSNIQYLTGFEFPHTIVLLAHTLSSIVTGYDLTTLPLLSKHKHMKTPGDFFNLKDPNVSSRRINERWDGDVLRNGANPTATPEPDYALRAWFTAVAANVALSDLLLGKELSTEFIDVPMLESFVDLASRVTRLELSKSRVYDNEFSKVQTESDGSMTVLNARYKTRIRASKQTHLEIRLENGDVVDAMVKGAKGRTSSARTLRPLKGDVSHIRVVGREERTNAEQAQYRFLLHFLTATRHTPTFVNIIWFPGNIQGIKHDGKINLSRNQSSPILNDLNDSQRRIVRAMLSTDPRNSLVIAHGPPGTGKTTTIAAAAALWVSNKVPCWIVAQSNVGVKNIAEKLFQKKVNFKLIVSKEFLFEWHEQLYVEVENMVIRSDELPNTPLEVSRMFGDVTVVLCTLGTLSNPKLNDCGLVRVLPVESLVIDEASQIDVFEFMHLFYKFSNVLTKVCFFGDPKQLPPHSAEDANLETIFSVKHLKKTAHFLDTQYRLPVPLGEFISKKVYDGKLRSSHGIVDRSCISFIDVSKGEETKEGTSFKNMEEVHMVVRIAKRYQQRGLKFCIITFYDLQRSVIASALQAENLPAGCVYNVDSFQGNEADYVIMSSVRTKQAGFLRSLPRMNVAMTRCRKGMIVVTNKLFLQRVGSNTLLGKLCQTWSQYPDVWIDWRTLLSYPVALPGLPLSNPSSQTVLASTSTSTSQRPLVHTTNAKIEEQSYAGQSSDPRTVTQKRKPLPSPTTTTTRTGETFPPSSSTARSGTRVSDETRTLEQRPGLAAALQIPKERQDPIPKLNPVRRQEDLAAHRSRDYDALPNWHQQQQRREAPTSTTSWLDQNHSQSKADVEAVRLSRLRAMQAQLSPSVAEASDPWSRINTVPKVSTLTPTPKSPPAPVRAHAPAPPPVRPPVPVHSPAPPPLPTRTRSLAHPLATSPPSAPTRASAPAPAHYTRARISTSPPAPTSASQPANTPNTDADGGFTSLMQPIVAAFGWMFRT